MKTMAYVLLGTQHGCRRLEPSGSTNSRVPSNTRSGRDRIRSVKALRRSSQKLLSLRRVECSSDDQSIRFLQSMMAPMNESSRRRRKCRRIFPHRQSDRYGFASSEWTEVRKILAESLRDGMNLCWVCLFPIDAEIGIDTS